MPHAIKQRPILKSQLNRAGPRDLRRLTPSLVHNTKVYLNVTAQGSASSSYSKPPLPDNSSIASLAPFCAEIKQYSRIETRLLGVHTLFVCWIRISRHLADMKRVNCSLGILVVSFGVTDR